MCLADTIGMVSGYGVALLGLVVLWLGFRMFKGAESGGKKFGAVVILLVALGMIGGGGWYGVVGNKFSKVEKAKHRKAGKDVAQSVDRFGALLTKCRDQVFPKMPYKPSDKAKAEKYASAIRAMKQELLTCYTGSKGVGEEKGAELDQIKWLVAEDDCVKFADKLIHKRTFCPQVIEILVEKGGFIDPLAAAEGDEAAQASPDETKALQAALAKLPAKLGSCSKEVLALYKPPKGQDPAKASQAAIGAMVKAFQACAAGKDGESLDLKTVQGLVGAADCKSLTAKLKGMESCTPALEAPTKVGWTFAQTGGDAGGQDKEAGKDAARAGGRPGPGKDTEGNKTPAARPRPRAR